MSIHGSNAVNGDIFSINNTAVVVPASITYTRSDLDSENSFRTVTGDLQRDRITVKRKLECEWSGLDGEEMKALLLQMQYVFFTVEFIDPYYNEKQQMVCYVGDRSPVMATYKNENGKIVPIYESFSCSFIEK